MSIAQQVAIRRRRSVDRGHQFRRTDDRRTIHETTSQPGGRDMTRIWQARLWWTAMSDDEIRACRSELVGSLGGANTACDTKPGAVGTAQKIDLAVDAEMEAAENGAEFAIDHRHCRQVDDAVDARLAQSSEHIFIASERIDTEHPGIDLMAAPRRRTDGGEQFGVRVVPGQAADPERDGRIQSGQERAQYQR